MDILAIAEHVGMQKSRLEILKADPTIDAGSLRLCDFVMGGIEQSLTELISPPSWVPVTVSGLKVLIASTTENIRQTKNAINEVVGTIDIETPDRSLRLDLAFTSLAALEYMLETLITAMARQRTPEQNPN
jgi:hypothetical protein